MLSQQKIGCHFNVQILAVYIEHLLESRFNFIALQRFVDERQCKIIG